MVGGVSLFLAADALNIAHEQGRHRGLWLFYLAADFGKIVGPVAWLEFSIL